MEEKDACVCKRNGGCLCTHTHTHTHTHTFKVFQFVNQPQRQPTACTKIKPFNVVAKVMKATVRGGGAPHGVHD
jgi:hypothetical protein